MAILKRSEIKTEDKWDLTSLFSSDEAWEIEFDQLSSYVDKTCSFEGKLKNKEILLNSLKELDKYELKLELLYSYAFLQQATDATNNDYNIRVGKISSLLSKFMAKFSFFKPEILTFSDPLMESIYSDEKFNDFKIMLQKVRRDKNHALSKAEEKILAMQQELTDTNNETFSFLTNVDMKFGLIDNEPLTQSTLGSYLHSKDPKIRKKAYNKFYKEFQNHQNTISSLLSGNIKQDWYFAKVRKFSTSLEKELFKDNVDTSVYYSLIKAVHSGLPILHEYYDLKAKLLGQNRLNHWDAYAPIVDGVNVITPYEEAVKITIEATKILGNEYNEIITKGLTKERWTDKFENVGKRSGAFSAGSFKGYPYLLLNYKEDNIRSVLTLAHEAGHSMHSYFSAKNNPYSCYNYTIFEAEVASTFNEYLVNQYLMKKYKNDKKMLAYIISCQLDDILATLFRQTMFAEYELKIHSLVEKGGVLTTENLRSIYRELLVRYFGPNVFLPKVADLEGLRIPHFYRNYYVYKYATGISASIALGKKVTNDKTGAAREKYLKFLKSGGSKFPIDSLKLAGVDMNTTKPIEMAISHFKELIDKLKKII